MLPIYVDLDDVLSETTRSFVTIVKTEFGKNVTYDAIHDFDLKISFNLTEKEHDRLFEIIHSPDVLLEFPPIPGAARTLGKWKKLGYPIAVVTGRLTSAHDASLEWLERHNIPYDTFTIVDKYRRKNMDTAIAVPLEDLSSRNFCLAVEDSASMAGHLSSVMDVPVALIDRPWNRAFRLPQGVRRVSSWDNLAEVFPEP